MLFVKTNNRFLWCTMSLPIEIVAKGLQRERQKAGLSLAEVARRAGIAKSTLSQLEAAQGNPSLETLWALCVALDIHLLN